ncbi:MAG TPA: integrase core domain-containing protein [Terriglobia bacterium]|nr:integrase core domain-containing protein [Terriglobia bacterium]
MLIRSGMFQLTSRREPFNNPERLPWTWLRTTNLIERCFVEVRRRIRPMACFVNVQNVDRIIYAIFNSMNEKSEWKDRTHTEEFYEITPFSLPIAELNRQLLAWEHTYNTIRPHQALGYLTPLEFLAQSSPQRKEPMCH